jgi:predicted dienelactone hydrolase
MYLNKLTIVCFLFLSPLFSTAAFEEPGLGTSPFKAGHQTWRLEDKTRGVDPYNNTAGSDTRLLVTEIWYPSDDVNGTVWGKNAPVTRSLGPFPLIIYSHGILSERMECAYLGRYLAERGVIVVSFTAPGTSLYDVASLNYEDIYKMPGDVSFLIDEMLRRSADKNSPFYRKIDQSRIGAAGTSLGANVTLMTTFNSSLRDPRISLAVTFGGGVHEELAENMFDASEADIPLLLVHGDIDPIVPYEENALELLGSAPGTTYLLTLIGGTHTGFAHAAKLFFMANNADQIGCLVLAKTSILQCDLPLPEGMKPQRQHDLCAMAVWSFIAMYFSDGAEERDAAADFFLNALPSKYGDEIELQSNRE